MNQQRIYKSILTISLLSWLLIGCRAIVTSAPQTELKVSSTTEVQAVPGENYLLEIRNLITKAQTDITILHFNFFTENGETRKLAEEIKAQKIKNPHLNIKIILEGEKDLEDPQGAAARNHLTKDFFDGTGIDVHFISGMRKEGTKPGVTHAKVIVVDDTVLTGSTNLTNTSLTKNNEFNLKIHDGKTAKFIRDYVQELLTDSTKLKGRTLTFQDGKVITDDRFQSEALEIINQSQKGEKLYIATYFFQTSDSETDAGAIKFLDALLSANSRGVSIKVYLEQNLDPKFKNTKITESNKETARKLADAGIDVYFDPGDKISHAKMIILDGAKKILLQGSTNIYRGDLYENHQINVRTENKDAVNKALIWLSAKVAYEGRLYSEQSVPKMFRLWFGYSQDRSNLSSLIDGVNQKLVPATLAYAKGRGLEAYLPAILQSDMNRPEVPDEVAIIAYKSADMYNAARQTPPLGPKYGPLHFEPGLFVKTTPEGFASTSAVAVEYKKESLELESGLNALHINAERVDWQIGDVTLFTLKPVPGASIKTMTDATFATLQNAVSHNRIDAALVAIDTTHEVIAVWTHRTRGILSITFPDDKIITLKAIKYTNTREPFPNMSADEGMNLKFDHALLPSEDLMRPILEY